MLVINETIFIQKTGHTSFNQKIGQNIFNQITKNTFHFKT